MYRKRHDLFCTYGLSMSRRQILETIHVAMLGPASALGLSISANRSTCNISGRLCGPSIATQKGYLPALPSAAVDGKISDLITTGTAPDVSNIAPMSM